MNLSDDNSIEIWFDEENDYYTWSETSYVYEDTYAVISDIMEWLDDNGVSVTDMETI